MAVGYCADDTSASAIRVATPGRLCASGEQFNTLSWHGGLPFAGI
jgi:hypothetical protein